MFFSVCVKAGPANLYKSWLFHLVFHEPCYGHYTITKFKTMPYC